MIRVVEGAPTEEGLKNEVLVRVPDYILVDNLSVGDRNDARALALGAGGTRLYVVNRLTPQILVYDVTRDASGAPRNQLLSRVEICAQAATMAVADMGKGERIYVPCFSNGQVWVVDPGRGRLEAIIESGRGPNAAVAASSVATDRKQVYVTNYAEDTISVIDARPGSPTENYVVMKIGVPRDTTLPVGAVSQRSLP
jgi:DNA-binding beta-propeller fold protein YncE